MTALAHPALPYTLDRTTRTILLPADVDGADPAELIGLPEAAKLLRGRGGRPPHVNTLRRWASRRRGWKVLLTVDRQDGKAETAIWTLRLPVARLGGDLATTRAAVLAFERARMRLARST